MLTESAVAMGQLTDDELVSLLATFPGSEEIGRRVREVLDKKSDGAIAKSDEELVDLVNAYASSMLRVAEEFGLSDAIAELRGFVKPVVVDRSEIERKRYRYSLGDVLPDGYWDGVTAEMAGAAPAVFGLKEALWGITANRHVSYHVLEPLLDRKLGLDHHMALWISGASATVVNGSLFAVRG